MNGRPCIRLLHREEVAQRLGLFRRAPSQHKIICAAVCAIDAKCHAIQRAVFCFMEKLAQCGQTRFFAKNSTGSNHF